MVKSKKSIQKKYRMMKVCKDGSDNLPPFSTSHRSPMNLRRRRRSNVLSSPVSRRLFVSRRSPSRRRSPVSQRSPSRRRSPARRSPARRSPARRSPSSIRSPANTLSSPVAPPTLQRPVLRCND